MPRLHNADGSDAGANPSFDNSLIIRDIDIAFGAGVSKTEGRRAAVAMLARDYPAGLAGTIGLQLDPQEGHKYDVNAGENIKALDLQGGDPLFHISGVDVNMQSNVSLAVDEKAHDLLNLVQIMQRKRDNLVNPLKMPTSAKARRSLQDHDAVTVFDGESPAGVVPSFALFTHLWSVIRIPVSGSGRIADVVLTTTGPHSKFAFAIFGAPVQPDDLLSLVGNPLADTTPWTDNADDLESAGWLEGWGSSNDACGYFPGSESEGHALTGRFKDSGTLEYHSTKPPWLWLCFFANVACRVSGRLRPAPLDP